MIHLYQEKGVLEIAFNRPEKRNALNLAGYGDLIQAFDRANKEDEIKVALLHGLGGHFTAGNDIQDFLDHPPFSQDSPVLGFLHCLAEFRKILIASIEGWAVGIGTTLLLHCDLVYAGQTARFQLPFIDLGLCPEAGSSYLLPRLVGYQKAADLLLTGRVVEATEAGEIGLVTEVLPPEQVLNHARGQAKAIAAKPTQALLATKRLLRLDNKERAQEVIRQETQEFTALIQSAEAKAAFLAFMKKQKDAS